MFYYRWVDKFEGIYSYSESFSDVQSAARAANEKHKLMLTYDIYWSGQIIHKTGDSFIDETIIVIEDFPYKP